MYFEPFSYYFEILIYLPLSINGDKKDETLQFA